MTTRTDRDLAEEIEKVDQAAAQGGIDESVPKNDPLHKCLFRLRKPLLLLLYQLLRIPLLPLFLDPDHPITTKKELITSELTLKRLPMIRLCRLSSRRWTLT